MIRRERKLILCTKYYYIRLFGLVLINATLFLSSWTMKYFFVSMILRAGSNEIESNIVNCRIWLVVRRVRKRRWKKNTKRENSRDIYGYMILNIYEKQLLESGRNNAIKVATWSICNLLLTLWVLLTSIDVMVSNF